MNSMIKKMTLGLAAAIVTGPVLLGASAEAGDYSGGGLKGMRGSYVPVPAPAPIPDYRAKWYLRFDAGLGLNGSTGLSENGQVFGNANDGSPSYGPQAVTPTGLAGIVDGGPDTGYTFGIGAGYYFSPDFRMDITAERISERSGEINDNFSYAAGAGDPSVAVPNTRIDASVRDRVVSPACRTSSRV